jgi:hypothetical protein
LHSSSYQRVAQGACPELKPRYHEKKNFPLRKEGDVLKSLSVNSISLFKVFPLN